MARSTLALLAKQKAAGLWDGGAVTVTVTTLGAGGKGDVSLLTVGRVLLRP